MAARRSNISRIARLLARRGARPELPLGAASIELHRESLCHGFAFCSP